MDGERPLSDAAHAEMQTWLVTLLRGAGWISEPEVSFNHFGDRGRIDVLAFHPAVRTLLITEVKTRLLTHRTSSVGSTSSAGWLR